MPTYGPTPTGFIVKPYETILAEIQASQRDEISPSLRNTHSALLGQLSAIWAAQIHEAWLELEKLWKARDPALAEGISLDHIGAIGDVLRERARPSVAVCGLYLEANVTVPAGSIISEQGVPDNRFVLTADVRSDSLGIYYASFESETPGPHTADANTLTVIDTPVEGWNSVNNANDAVPGSGVETDDDYRERRRELVDGQSGSNTVSAIEVRLAELEETEAVLILENDTDEHQGVMPPHSLRCVVQTPVSPVPADTIAQAIWDRKAAGIATVGDESGTAVDRHLNGHEIRFDTAAILSIWLEVDVLVNDDGSPTGWPADGVDQVKAALIDLQPGIGEDVIVSRLIAAAVGITGVIDVTGARAGWTSGTTGPENLPISSDQIAGFDTSRITVNVTKHAP